MNDIEEAKQKLEEQAAEIQEEFMPVVLKYLKAMADNFADVFLQEDKNLKNCIRYIFQKLQFLALESCLTNKNYTSSSNGAGTHFSAGEELICELAESYYFFSEQDVTDSLCEEAYDKMMSQLSREVSEQKTAEHKTKVPKKPQQDKKTIQTESISKSESEKTKEQNKQLSLF